MGTPAFPSTGALLSFILLCIFGLSRSHASETVIVNKSFNGREIKVKAGTTIQVELEQPGATGYTWEIQNLDTEHFKTLSVKHVDRGKGGDFVGAPILKTWRIETIRAGKSKLKFLLYRPWEGEKNATDTFVLDVRILGAK